MDVLVLIPAYNEAGSLTRVVHELAAEARDIEILVVDDASTDGTPVLLPRLPVRWLRLSQRLGTGAAVRTGLRYAVARGYNIVVRVDGDGQHPAEVIDRLVSPLRRHGADVVIGSRYAGSSETTTPFARRISHRVLGLILSVMTRRRVTDPTSGMWAFGPRALKVLVEHHPSGYPEPELALFLSRNNLRVVEVPVNMRDRLAGRSSLTLRRAGAAAARLLLVLLVVPLRSAVWPVDD